MTISLQRPTSAAANRRDRVAVVPPAAQWDGGGLHPTPRPAAGVRTTRHQPHLSMLAQPDKFIPGGRTHRPRRKHEGLKQFLMGGLLGCSVFVGLVVSGNSESPGDTVYPAGTGFSVASVK